MVVADGRLTCPCGPHRVLSDPSASLVDVEQRDRPSGLGNSVFLPRWGPRAANDVHRSWHPTTDDLVRDVIEALESMCARLDGRCAPCNRTLRAVRAAKHDLAPVAATG